MRRVSRERSGVSGGRYLDAACLEAKAATSSFPNVCMALLAARTLAEIGAA